MPFVVDTKFWLKKTVNKISHSISYCMKPMVTNYPVHNKKNSIMFNNVRINKLMANLMRLMGK